jgi:DNA-binding MarR family transcriptional regulator
MKYSTASFSAGGAGLGPSGSVPSALPWSSSLGEPLEFLRLLWAVSHALHSTSKRLEVTMGITGPQRLALQMIGRFPQITAGQLAHLLHVDPSTLTGIVQRLVRRGLIQRRPDAQDGRRTLLALTAEGRRFDVAGRRSGKGGAETAEAAVARALGRLRPTEVAAARRTLSALSEALGHTPSKASTENKPGRAARSSAVHKVPRTTTPPAKKPQRQRRLPTAAPALHRQASSPTRARLAVGT